MSFSLYLHSTSFWSALCVYNYPFNSLFNLIFDIKRSSAAIFKPALNSPNYTTLIKPRREQWSNTTRFTQQITASLVQRIDGFRPLDPVPPVPPLPTPLKYTISRTLPLLLVLWTECTDRDLRMLWLCCDRRIVDTKLVSQAFPAEDIPMRRWTDICRQHRYRWKCCRNTPDTQYRATGLMQELRKLWRGRKGREYGLIELPLSNYQCFTVWRPGDGLAKFQLKKNNFESFLSNFEYTKILKY